MQVWKCKECGQALGFIDGRQWGLQYGRGKAQLATLPARLTCPGCGEENERSAEESPPSE
jgi:hypothetical protein